MHSFRKKQNKCADRHLLNFLYLLSAAMAVTLLLCTDIWYLKSGSMAPSYPAGSLVITSPFIRPHVGSVCAYEHNGMTVVHRIISVSPDGYITQGDANNCADPAPVSEDLIKGTMLIGIPAIF